MPLDASLNKDHDDIVLRHVAATCLLAWDDPRKFSLATPDECSRAYWRIWEANGIPSKRIVQDILKTQAYWKQVWENDGLNINLNINGHRGDIGRAAKTGKHGGRREKTKAENLKQLWYHPDAKTSMEEFFQESTKKFQEKLSEVRKEHKDISVMDDKVFEPEDFDRAETTTLDEDAPAEGDHTDDEDEDDNGYDDEDDEED